MDRLSRSDPCNKVVFVKGSQVGGTEAGNNWLGYVMDVAPGPTLVVQPTVELGKRWATQRLSKLIDSTPAIKAVMPRTRGKDGTNTIQMKEFPGGVLIVGGANSPANLRSMPIRNLMLDEVDGYPADCGEGDPVELAIARQRTFADSKVFLCSTPVQKGTSRIWTEWELSDQRLFFVPCPHCEAMQPLKWERIKWPDDEPMAAKYLCDHCNGAISNHQKSQMLAKGEWRATSTADFGVYGYHLSALYSPVGWLTWGEIARQYVQAANDPVKLQVFYNTILGLPYEDGAEDGIESLAIYRRRDIRTFQPIPRQVRVLTAGIDVQKDRFEIEIVGWGPGQESWSIDYIILPGDPNRDHAWSELDRILLRRINTEGDRSLQVEAACIDSGGHWTEHVYRYCGARQRRRIWAIKGREGEGRRIWPARPNRKNKVNCPLYTIGVDTAKESIYARLDRIATPGPGYCHFPADRDLRYFEQLTSERRVLKEHGGRTYRRWVLGKYQRNEALDCRVYALAALHGWLAIGFDLDEPVDKPANDTSDKGQRRPGYLNRRRNRWM